MAGIDKKKPVPISKGPKNGKITSSRSPKVVSLSLSSNSSILDREYLSKVCAQDKRIYENRGAPSRAVKTTITRYEEIDLPEDLKVLHEGLNHGLSRRVHIGRPDWFDATKFTTGQEFAVKYYFGVTFAEMLSIFLLLSFDNNLNPMIFTDKSGTSVTAFKRYLSTVLRVKSWYEQDVFDKETSANSNIQIVRIMHASVAKTMNEMSVDQVKDRIKHLNDSKQLVCSSIDSIGQDFISSPCANRNLITCGDRAVFVNQFNMAITQFAFLGLMILYPEKFGAANATEDQLEGFIHLWRVLGYLMGTEDRFNFCNGTLAEVKARSRDVVNYWVIPNFTCPTPEWEHFCRCFADGVGFYMKPVTFDASFLYLCYTIEIQAKQFSAKTTWASYVRYLLMRFVLCYAARIPWILNMCNGYLKVALRRATRFTDEQLSDFARSTNELTST